MGNPCRLAVQAAFGQSEKQPALRCWRILPDFAAFDGIWLPQYTHGAVQILSALS
ncbi:hypothetical protein [Kingella denitrificans]|uniref:hypothetical protein n=1 Tax=Kingella denitrificans TaxID=502 RepID=UPI00164C9C98|nr:hypothetical protein [Kingella denitrificans]